MVYGEHYGRVYEVYNKMQNTIQVCLQKYFNKNFDMQQNSHTQTVRVQQPGLSP